jgi:hypothetical protein
MDLEIYSNHYNYVIVVRRFAESMNCCKFPDPWWPHGVRVIPPKKVILISLQEKSKLTFLCELKRFCFFITRRCIYQSQDQKNWYIWIVLVGNYRYICNLELIYYQNIVATVNLDYRPDHKGNDNNNMSNDHDQGTLLAL